MLGVILLATAPYSAVKIWLAITVPPRGLSIISRALYY